MKEHPILFSSEMVRAIMEGRKTQTRRVVTKQNSELGSGEWEWLELADAWPDLLWGVTPGLKVPTPHAPPDYCPECVVRLYPRTEKGSRLWVRETWQAIQRGPPDDIGIYPVDVPINGMELVYRATDDDGLSEQGFRWRPSIHMPRWASRLTLEVLDVRVERLQEITVDDMLAEGIRVSDPRASYVRAHFMDPWDSLNAKRGYGWEENPWVWVITFNPLGG
jgi:hypothetical protein